MYTARVPAKTKSNSIFFTRTLIIEFALVSSRAQHPVIHGPWNFIHALEKRRRVIDFHAECDQKFFFSIFTGCLNSIASSSRWCLCLKPRLCERRVFIATQEVWNEHSCIRSLRARKVPISNLYLQMIRDFMLFESGFLYLTAIDALSLY